MILLMSEYKDNSTAYVSQWLLYWKVRFVRIDAEETYFIEEILLKNNDFDYVISNRQGKVIRMSEIKAFWYRRGNLNLYIPEINFVNNSKLRKEILSHLIGEKLILENYFYYLLKNKPHIGTFGERSVNKLRVLNEAMKLGITIPSTFITVLKSKLKHSPASKLVTKSIYEGFRIDFEMGNFMTYTEVITAKDIPQTFFPSLFQQQIKKEADIRVFYLSGEFYSMAIRSQSNKQTTTDFRKYLKGIGNRSFPFQLPDNLQEKLHKLMNIIGLESGSIDLIFTEDGQFVFLEVNPVGQFGMTSLPCNYFLEKKVASKLVSLSNS